MRPEGDERPEGPTFGSSAYVYAEAILLQSWLALRERTEVTLPTDIEPLIETVYGTGGATQTTELAARLAGLDREHREASQAESNQAQAVVLAPPDSDDPFHDLARLDDGDNPAVHKSLRAATRLGDPSVDVVPVVDRGGRTVLVGEPHISIDLGAKEPPPRPIVVAAARQAIGISHRRVVAALLRDPVPRTFEKSGHLRFHRALRLDDNGCTTIAGVALRLDDALGLVVGSLDDPNETPPETSA